MIKQFEKLNPEERELLLKAPVLVSILIASRDNEISKAEMAESIKFTHLKTFTSDPLLRVYYKQVDKHFEEYFEELANKYAPFSPEKHKALEKEINRLNVLIGKLDKPFAAVLHKSLSSYTDHVKKAEKTILEDFVFPLPIRGITA